MLKLQSELASLTAEPQSAPRMRSAIESQALYISTYPTHPAYPEKKSGWLGWKG